VRNENGIKTTVARRYNFSKTKTTLSTRWWLYSLCPIILDVITFNLLVNLVSNNVSHYGMDAVLCLAFIVMAILCHNTRLNLKVSAEPTY
jgi:hypothetical protein